MSEHYKNSLTEIIANECIMTVFQPIVSLIDGSILGYEALSRITCSNSFDSIEDLFKCASKYKKLWDLEFLCRSIALETAYNSRIFTTNKRLFLNVAPNILNDKSFKEGFTKKILNKFNIMPRDIIFEITERNIINNFKDFVASVNHYKHQDFKIAIDDAGAGYSSLNLISDLEPHYIKINMSLIRNIDSDKLKFALVKGMVEVSKASNISLIAEGIETYDELKTLLNIGVQYGQGYLIQKPNKKILDINQRFLSSLKAFNTKKKVIDNYSIPDMKIKHITTHTDTVYHNEKVDFIYKKFNKTPDCFGLCIIDNEKPVGIITPENLSLNLSGKYGYTLNSNKPISKIMDTDFLSVDLNTPINEVSSLAMARASNKLYDFIVVVENDKYFGTVTVKDLLQKSSELEITAAKHQNPLSGLPGNLMIEQQLIKCFSSSSDHSIAYIDIDNFKAFNDSYGFEKGDMIIKLLAQILSVNFYENFIGHIGGDDFLVVFDKEVKHGLFNEIICEFKSKALDFYNDIDKARGYTLVPNRKGVLEKFPLLTITCVVINTKNHKYLNIYELTKTLSDLKKRSRRKKSTCN